MENRIYFWISLAVFISLGLLINVQKANAMVAVEVDPGVIELLTTNEKGFKITDVAEKVTPKGETNRVYFCLKESFQKSNFKKSKSRCFYGTKEEFREVKEGIGLNGLQYSLKDRIYNTSAIPLKKNVYYYKALILRPQI